MTRTEKQGTYQISSRLAPKAIHHRLSSCKYNLQDVLTLPSSHLDISRGAIWYHHIRRSLSIVNKYVDKFYQILGNLLLGYNFLFSLLNCIFILLPTKVCILIKKYFYAPQWFYYLRQKDFCPCKSFKSFLEPCISKDLGLDWVFITAMITKWIEIMQYLL